MFVRIGYQQTTLPGPYISKGRELNDWLGNKKKPQNNKLSRKLLLTVTVAGPKRFTPKNKPVIYTSAFV